MTENPSIRPRTRRPRLPGNALAAMGQDAGYNTANERAAILGISRSHLLHVERGEFMPSPGLVDAMSEAYHKPVSVIELAAQRGIQRLAERKIAHIRGFS